MDIYNDKRLHPGFDNLIKEHYKDFYDTVFISFTPFFKIGNDDLPNCNFQKAHQITFEQAQQERDIFKKMPKPKARIYSYQNDNYPGDKAILEKGIAVSWEEVKTGCGFENIGDINKALKTSIGVYKSVFEKEDFVTRLLNFTATNKVFLPTEGHFEVFSKVEILKAFRLLGKTTIFIEDESQEQKIELDISDITIEKFIDAISFKDYYLYDKEREILFAVGWDDFFFLICSNAENIKQLNSDLDFEGFYCNETTEASWEMTKEEIKIGLEKEIQIKL